MDDLGKKRIAKLITTLVDALPPSFAVGILAAGVSPEKLGGMVGTFLEQDLEEMSSGHLLKMHSLLQFTLLALASAGAMLPEAPKELLELRTLLEQRSNAMTQEITHRFDGCEVEDCERCSDEDCEEESEDE